MVISIISHVAIPRLLPIRFQIFGPKTHVTIACFMLYSFINLILRQSDTLWYTVKSIQGSSFLVA